MLGPATKSDRALLALVGRHADRLAGGPDNDGADLAATMRLLAVGGGGDDRDRDNRDRNDRLAEAFGAVFEAYRRTTGSRPGQASVLAGLALHDGVIASMPSPDDAAVAAMFPAAVWALHGGGVHVATGPSESAQAVVERIGPVLACLGLTIGVLPVSRAGAPERAARRAAYAASVTVGHYHEFGYDYLRDNLAYPGETTQRGLPCAIVLEADTVLLGEAFVPMLISAPDPAGDHIERMAKLAAGYERGPAHVSPGEPVLRTSGSGALADRLAADVASVVWALQGHRLGEDYVVCDGRLVLRDQATGRLLPERRFKPGVHQAIEAREGIPLSPARMTLAEITVGSLFRRYRRLAGICADPNPDAARLTHLYRLSGVRDATGRPARARSGARRLVSLASHTSTAPAGPRRDTREADRLKLGYVQVVDDQRDEIYALRDAILHGVRPPRHTEQILVDLVEAAVSQHCPAAAPSAAWDLSGLRASLAELYPTRLDPDELAALNTDQAMVAAASRRDAEQVYADRVTGLGVDVFADMERQIELNVIDRYWRQHLAELADLMHTIESVDNDSALRRYRLGAAAAFQKMRNTIGREIIQYVFNLEVEAEES